MFKVSYKKTFIAGLRDFISSMQNSYFNFYSDTGLLNVGEILEIYYLKYEGLRDLILEKIGEIVSNGVHGRKIITSNENIETFTYSFYLTNYFILISGTRDNENKEIILEKITITTT